MFETSVVQAQAKAAARRPLLFSVSIGAHVAAIAGIVTMSVVGVTLPKNAPHQFAIPFVAELKPMLGDGGQPQQPKKTPVATPPQQVQKQPQAPATPVAPQVVPDQVPQVASTTPASTDIGPTSGDGSSNATPGTPGVPWGSRDGAVPDGPPVTHEEPAAKIYQVAGDVKAPVAISRVTPPYPELARRMRINGFVILECIIDQNGQVRDAHVVRSSFAAFEQPALDAIHGWKFSPGTLNGRPVNVQFNLTVTFQLN